MKILIVEDDVNSRILLERALISQGYNVESASNGVEALRKVEQSPPDLIISDILMPEMDGFELCRRLKTDKNFSNIPFVFYTATYTDQRDEELAMSLGASLFIVKPAEPEYFLKAIKDVIEKHLENKLLVSEQPILDLRELDRMQVEALARKLDKKVKEIEKEREKIRKMQKDWEDIFQSIGHPTMILDGQHNILSINRTTIKVAGARSAEEFIGRKCYEIFHNTNKPPEECPLQKLLASGKLEESEIDVEALGGIYHVSCTPVFDEEGNLQKIIHIATDITERKKYENSLRESEKRYRLLYESMRDAFVKVDMSGNIIETNRAYQEMIGYTQDELSKLIYKDITPKKWHDFESRIVEEQILIKGYSKVYEKEYIRKDGSVIPVELRTFLLYDESGQPNAMWAIVRDITERKQAEDEIHEKIFEQAAINTILSESWQDKSLEMILQIGLNIILSVPWISQQASGSIYIVEDDPQQLVMKAFYNLPEQIKKNNAHIFMGKGLLGKYAQTRRLEYIDKFNEQDEICCRGINACKIYMIPIIFGNELLGLINIYLLEKDYRNEKKEDFLIAFANTLAMIIKRKQDEKEKEKLYNQLLQAQKLETVGRLASGIAHDFNNILSAMIGYSHLLMMKMKEGDPLRNYVNNISSLVDKAADLTKNLLAFSRKQIMNRRPVNINEIIKRMENLISRIIGEDIHIHIKLSEKDLVIMADPVQIEQVLMNLASNSRDAMPKGGHFFIESDFIVFDKKFIKEHGFGTENIYALLIITDTGVGMDENIRKKIFEPFFTTKEVGKGTGLGLSVVYGIIKQHEGYINVYSEPNKGTTFKIYLPLIQENILNTNVEHEEVYYSEIGTETLLLAEDEYKVREFIKNLLSEYGYKVIEAIDGEDAIQKFKLYKDKIQLLLLDLILPQKNGREVYEFIREINPNIKVIYMSGYPENYIDGMTDINADLIMKPILPARLLKKIREVLRK